MSGHNKWSKIKHKKEASDIKRSQIFSKLSKLISVAARKSSDLTTNLELKNAIDQAKFFNMPIDNIQRAIKRASDKEFASIQSLRMDAMGPNGVAFIIEGLTDNSNRTIAEVKNIMRKHDVKLVQPSSLNWMFTKTDSDFTPNNEIVVENDIKKKLDNFLEELGDYEDVKEIYSNLGD